MYTPVSKQTNKQTLKKQEHFGLRMCKKKRVNVRCTVNCMSILHSVFFFFVMSNDDKMSLVRMSITDYSKWTELSQKFQINLGYIYMYKAALFEKTF